MSHRWKQIKSQNWPKFSSCICNTKTIWNEDETVDVRAVLPIKRGTEITKNYVNRFHLFLFHLFLFRLFHFHLFIFTHFPPASWQPRRDKNFCKMAGTSGGWLGFGWSTMSSLPRCKCLRCLDPLEALSFTSAVACLRCLLWSETFTFNFSSTFTFLRFLSKNSNTIWFRCKEGLVLAMDPTDPGDISGWSLVMKKSFRNWVGVWWYDINIK